VVDEALIATPPSLSLPGWVGRRKQTVWPQRVYGFTVQATSQGLIMHYGSGNPFRSLGTQSRGALSGSWYLEGTDTFRTLDAVLMVLLPACKYLASFALRVHVCIAKQHDSGHLVHLLGLTTHAGNAQRFEHVG
jgi:hypothetical protein